MHLSDGIDMVILSISDMTLESQTVINVMQRVIIERVRSLLMRKQ